MMQIKTLENMKNDSRVIECNILIITRSQAEVTAIFHISYEIFHTEYLAAA